MKKLLCFSMILFMGFTHPVLWDENTDFDQKLNDCIIAVEKNDIDFFKDNTEEIKKSQVLLTANAYGSQFKKVEEYSHYNILSIATKHKRKEIIEIILKLPYAQNYTYYKLSPLYWAVQNALDNIKDNKIQEDDCAIVQLLLDHGHNPYQITSKDNKEINSFILAIKQNNLELINMLVDADKKKNFITYGRNGMSPLYESLAMEKEDIAQFFIESDVSQDGKMINEKHDASGTTLLYMTIDLNQTKILVSFIAVGAGLDNKNKYNGDAEFHIAAKENYKACIAQLIENGANPSIKNKQEKLAEELTSDDDSKKLLQNARSIQKFFEDNTLDKTFDLITSFPLLGFALHTMNSSNTFSTFYKLMSEKKEHNKSIASLADKESFQNATDFRDTVLKKAQLRLKAHLYNLSIISEFEYTQKFGDEGFKKMLLTAKRIKKYN